MRRVCGVPCGGRLGRRDAQSLRQYADEVGGATAVPQKHSIWICGVVRLEALLLSTPVDRVHLQPRNGTAGSRGGVRPDECAWTTDDGAVLQGTRVVQLQQHRRRCGVYTYVCVCAGLLHFQSEVVCLAVRSLHVLSHQLHGWVVVVQRADVACELAVVSVQRMLVVHSRLVLQ